MTTSRCYPVGRNEGDPYLDWCHHWGMATYGAVHSRLRAKYGPATRYVCACGQRAEQWAYVGPRSHGESRAYSTNLRLYKPMCAACHRHYDDRVRGLLAVVADGILW